MYSNIILAALTRIYSRIINHIYFKVKFKAENVFLFKGLDTCTLKHVKDYMIYLNNYYTRAAVKLVYPTRKSHTVSSDMLYNILFSYLLPCAPTLVYGGP